MKNEIRLMESGLSGEHSPKYWYDTEIEGQGNFLLETCKKTGKVRVEQYSSQVGIFSKKKIVVFIEVIKQSFDYEEKIQPVMNGNNLVCKDGRALMGVLINKDGEIHCYATEKHYREMKYFVFTKQVPKFTHSHIFESYKELVKHMEQKESLIV